MYPTTRHKTLTRQRINDTCPQSRYESLYNGHDIDIVTLARATMATLPLALRVSSLWLLLPPLPEVLAAKNNYLRRASFFQLLSPLSHLVHF